MRIANKKMFIRGIVLFLLAVAIAVSRFLVFTDNNHGLLKPVIVIGVCLLAAVYHLVMAMHLDGEDDETGEDKQA